MSFSRRVKGKTEHSGIEEISPELRHRLAVITEKHLVAAANAGVWAREGRVSSIRFQLDVEMELGRSEPYANILAHGVYNEVLDTIEIFLFQILNYAPGYYPAVLQELLQAL